MTVCLIGSTACLILCSEALGKRALFGLVKPDKGEGGTREAEPSFLKYSA